MKGKSNNTLRREQVANALRGIDRMDYAPRVSDGAHERVSCFNADLATESYFSEPLTQYAVDFTDLAQLDAELEFFAPSVQVNNRFEYSQHDSAEAFLSDGDDDERPSKSDFKEIEETEGKVNGATVNRGLQITLDMDKIHGRADWEEHYTKKLLARIKRNQLRRAVALLSTGAVNTAKTWDTSAGKDPDMDVINELITGADITGIKPCRVGYGDTAWAKRFLSLRSQNNPGGYSSSVLTPDAIASLLGVDSVLKSTARYTASASTKAQVLGNLVLMFNATSGVDTADASNIKRFFSMGASEEGGGMYQVYSARISAKRHVIAVGHYELMRLTSTLGIRKFTVS